MFLYPRHRFSSSTALFVFLLMLLPSVARADWERMPDPGIAMTADSVFHDPESQGWGYSEYYAACSPFVVGDGAGHLYIGRAAGQYYDTWLRYDESNQTYTTLASPEPVYHAPYPETYSTCAFGWAGGAYTDGRVFADFLNFNDAIAEYNVAGNSWSAADSPTIYSHMSTISSDANHEMLYWFDGLSNVGRIDPELGDQTIESGVLPDAWSMSSALAVMNDKLYLAGGFTVENYWSCGIPHSEGFSLTDTAIYNFATGQEEPIADLPVPASFVGSGVGNGFLHFVGGNWVEFFDYYVVAFGKFIDGNEIYHAMYDPATDAWAGSDDLPPGCLPWSVAQSGPWLYGLFTCVDEGMEPVLLYRTDIASATWPATTTTTTTSTNATTTTTQPADDDVTDDDSSDDDLTDDDTLDDDLADDDSLDDDLADDDTTDDDASDDDFTASASEDDDDDSNNGCG